MSQYESILWLLLLFVAILYIGVPLHIRFSHRHAANPQFRAFKFANIDPSLSQFFIAYVNDFFDLGFDEPTLVQIHGASPHTNSYVIMWLNRPKGDKAMLVAVVAPSFGRKLVYIEFSTRYESGEVFDTSNSSELLFPPGRETIRTQLPQVHDPRLLYQLHSHVMGKHHISGKRVLYEPGNALDYLARSVLIKSFEKYTRRGLMYYDEGNNCYRPTLKGAFLMTWLLLEPIKTFRKAALWRKARKIVEEFEQSHKS
jgi:hypothetical protein